MSSLTRRVLDLRDMAVEARASHRLLRSAGLTEPVYAYPQMVRAGLGHMMGAWARCVVWSRKHSIPMLAPQWRQFRIGPYVRREKDKRAYHHLFRDDGYVGGAARFLAIALARRVPEARAEDTLREASRGAPTVVVFHEDHGWDGLRDSHEVLLSEVLRITRPPYLREAIIQEPFIGVHVRRGDFTSPDAEAVLRAGRKNLRTPVEWYAEALTELRRSLGVTHPARLFSDGSEAELEPLLRLDRVELMPTRSAITDILSLSQARAVLASGSGFSQWACFLGQAPSLWFPGQRHYHLRAGIDGAALEPEWESGQPLPEAFVKAVAAGWQAPSYLLDRVG